MVGMIRFMYFPADDFPAVQIQNQVQIVSASDDTRWQVRHIPAPHLGRCCGNVRCRWARSMRRSGAPAMLSLSMRSQHTTEARFTGQIDAFISEHRHNPRWRHCRKSAFVGDVDYLASFIVGEGMSGRRTHRIRRPSPCIKPCSASAFQRCSVRRLMPESAQADSQPAPS